MHDWQPGLYLYLAGLILLIVVLAYLLPWLEARRKRTSGRRPPARETPAEPPGVDGPDAGDPDGPAAPEPNP